MDNFEELTTRRAVLEARLNALREETKQLVHERNEVNAAIKAYLLAEDPVLERAVEWKALPSGARRLKFFTFSDDRPILTYRDLVSLAPWELFQVRGFSFGALEQLEAHLTSLGLELREDIPPPRWSDELERYLKRKAWAEARRQKTLTKVAANE